MDEEDGSSHRVHLMPSINRRTTRRRAKKLLRRLNSKEWKDKRVAVAVTISHVEECDAIRLQQLVQTSDNMDVWILHGHDILLEEEEGDNTEGTISNNELVATSNSLLRQIPEIKLWPQRRGKLEYFDSIVSGTTKSSFLKFVSSHPEYDFVWHLEADAFYTGDWSDILWLSGYPKTDFLYPKAFNQSGTDWWTKLADGHCSVQGRTCEEICPFQVYWMVSRMSHRFACTLLEVIGNKTAIGHHEAVTLSVAEAFGFVHQPIDRAWIAKDDGFHAGNSKPFSERELERRSNSLAQGGVPQPNKLYHPVKCAAYSSAAVMEAEINQWL